MFRSTPLLLLSLPALALLIGTAVLTASAQQAGALATATSISPAAVQTERGAVLYRLACAMCHGDKLEGGSAEALAGNNFRATYQGLPPRAIHHLIAGLHGHLPPLTKQEALDVTVFILNFNGLPLNRELVEAGLDVVPERAATIK
ncbi:cytochrome c [Deinococcus sp. QL22]|uniref:c-type cytochrome n=1 Tax=Deinococcus sp. QL22 TaxID=2939437 RepID=UPI0020183538|nr:cytochrome c [Deinococcus sp. QL22]UQN07362.1 cytochrome c [Deinococcus sp. QL22]